MNAIKSFVKEFKLYNIHEIEDDKIQDFINANKLNVKDIESLYTESWIRKK